MSRQRGSTLVESSIVLLLFLVILIGVLDSAQILFFHHFLNERARAGARYAALHSCDPATVRNVVVYNTPTPDPDASGLFGLATAMVGVFRYDSGGGADRIEVRITGFQLRFLSPWLAGIFTPGPFRAVRPVESECSAL